MMTTTTKIIALGNEGLSVPAIGLGCMGMSGFYGHSDSQSCLGVLDRAVELGCTFWDTADMYGPFLAKQKHRCDGCRQQDRIRHLNYGF